MAKKQNAFKKPLVKKSQEQNEVKYPVEVLLYDCITKQRVIASYAGESKWWYGTRMYKVYHPSFNAGTRWVMKLGRVLGYYNPMDDYPTQKQARDEKAMLKMLMAQ
jgi:hypothetical protein